jgi:hypothetical protein
VLAAEHLLDFGGLDLGLERVERLLQIGADLFAGFCPLEQDAEIVDLADDGVAERDLVDQLTPSLQRALRLALILPEVRRRDAGFDACQFRSSIGCVKDSSAGRSPV